MRILIACLLATACGVGMDTTTPGSSSDAGTLPDGGTVTTPAATQHAWLDPQNAARAGVNPAPATPMPALTWSESAAQFAQGWADRCVYEHSTTAERGNRGENIAATAQSGQSGSTIGDAVALWVNEASDYTYATNSCASGQDCGHYTQIVWASTLRAGCATTHCTTGSPFPGFTEWDFWVCDYEPPGNFVGQRPY
jgi:pathogenesis-related protein 1